MRKLALLFILLMFLHIFGEIDNIPSIEELEKKGEKHEFQADVARLMDIIINSLYTNKEVFLREIISNGSDALDKIRYLSIQDPSIMETNKELKIMVDFDKDEKTISITDTGIGMTKEELIKQLGTVAKSGTAAFVEALSKGNSLNLIGRFGVGFYSCYLVSKKVYVYSKSNDDDEQHIWMSTAGSQFTVISDPEGNTLKRGTKVKLFLKDDANEYLDQERLKTMAKRFSEFINYPIFLKVSKNITKEIEVPENTTSEMEVQEAEDSRKVKKNVTETVLEWEHINPNKAIWQRKKSEITPTEYKNFYKSISKDSEDPLTYSHISAEGEVEFKALLYVPKTAPFDLFDSYYTKKSSMKLYVKKVLITDQYEELMPRYMTFIKGVLDSDDLPLNVNREQLQEYKIVKVISKKLVRSAIDMLIKLAKNEAEDQEDESEEETEEEDEEDEVPTTEKGEAEKPKGEKKPESENKTKKGEDRYSQFWKNYGKNIKLGIVEDTSNRHKLAKLLRFYTSKSKDQLTTLDEYISRMKENQDVIYYLSGDSKEQILKSPLLQKLIKRNIEVILLDDPLDEYAMGHINEYEKKKCQNAAKGEIKTFDQDEDIEKKKHRKLTEIFNPLTEWWKNRLGSKVEKVEITSRLADSPCIVSTSEYGQSSHMEKISRTQAFVSADKVQSHMIARKIFEINPAHPIIKKMLEKVQENRTEDMKRVSEYADVLFGVSLLNSEFPLDDPSDFNDKVERLVREDNSIDINEPISEVPLEYETEIEKNEREKKEDEEKEQSENTLD